MISATSSRTVARRTQGTRTRAQDQRSAVVFPIGHPFTLMETDPFVFQWMTWRRDSEVKFGISLNFDEFNNKVEVAGISHESLAGEKNRRLSEIPAACSYVFATW